jgi:signal transduction histidine kinase
VRHAVENGIEHDDSDEPHVEVRAAALDNGAVIEVEDDGPGIPESEIEPLVAGEETRLVHGSGAGLWILDRVVQYSGGTVEFDTDSDGTVVRLIVDQTALPQ